MAGFAMKAGKCLSGAFACEKAVKAGKARLVIADAGLSERSKADMKNMCEYYETALVFTEPPGRIGNALGRPGKKVFAVCDHNFAKKLIEIYKESCEQLPEV